MEKPEQSYKKLLKGSKRGAECRKHTWNISETTNIGHSKHQVHLDRLEKIGNPRMEKRNRLERTINSLPKGSAGGEQNRECTRNTSVTPNTACWKQCIWTDFKRSQLFRNGNPEWTRTDL